MNDIEQLEKWIEEIHKDDVYINADYIIKLLRKYKHIQHFQKKHNSPAYSCIKVKGKIEVLKEILNIVREMKEDENCVKRN